MRKSMMKDSLTDQFQYTVAELLVRNKSILDSLTKFQDSNARVNRSIIKAVTQCGCIKINAQKQPFHADKDYDEILNEMSTHVEGSLCDNCRDIIEKEMGRSLFYLASICNTLDLNIYDILIKEDARVRMLGKYSLR